MRVLTGYEEGESPETDVLYLSSGEPETVGHLLKDIEASGRTWLLQQRIRPHPLLEQFNPSTLNVVRAVTFLTAQGDVEIDHALLRLGMPSAQIETVGAGAVVVRLDTASGAFAPHGSVHHLRSVEPLEAHPSSQMSFEGQTLPNWDEAKRVLTRAARAAAPNRYIGWDVAVTDEGVFILEGNPDANLKLTQLGTTGLLTRRFLDRLGSERSFWEARKPTSRPLHAARVLLRNLRSGE